MGILQNWPDRILAEGKPGDQILPEELLGMENLIRHQGGNELTRILAKTGLLDNMPKDGNLAGLRGA